MRQQLLDLNEIQKIDLEIREIAKLKESLPARLEQFQENIASAQAELETLTTERDAIDGEISTLETTIHSEIDKARKWERRLNDIRNQREYLALSREVEGSRRATRQHEESVIEFMAKKEELEAQMETIQDKLAEDEVDGDAERDRVNKEMADIDARIAAETERREALGPKIKAALLRKYEAVRAKRLGLGLVPAVDGSCHGCNMKLPPQLYNILQRVDSIESCPSCQRILVFQGVLEQANVTTGDGGRDDSVEASP